MALRSRFGSILVLIVVTAGCSHGTISALPAAPTSVAPAVSVLSLVITPRGGGTILAGGSVPLTSSGTSTGQFFGALARFTDGSSKYVEAVWTTSDANVLVVANASLRAINRGTVTLTAAAEGLVATETFVVEPGIAGTWAGSFVVTQCGAGGGSMQELICNATPGRAPGLMPVGASVPVSFVISQSGTALTAVAALGLVRGTLAGSDRGGNFLTLMGDLTVDRTTLTMIFWDSHVTVDAMEGVAGFQIRSAGIPSHAQVTGKFVGVTRR